jgi:hypothetical protein
MGLNGSTRNYLFGIDFARPWETMQTTTSSEHELERFHQVLVRRLGSMVTARFTTAGTGRPRKEGQQPYGCSSRSLVFFFFVVQYSNDLKNSRVRRIITVARPIAGCLGGEH